MYVKKLSQFKLLSAILSIIKVFCVLPHTRAWNINSQYKFLKDKCKHYWLLLHAVEGKCGHNAISACAQQYGEM